MNTIVDRITESCKNISSTRSFIQQLEKENDDRDDRLNKYLNKQTLPMLKAALEEIWPHGVVFDDDGMFGYRMYPQKMRNGCGETLAFTEKGIYIAALYMVIATLDKKGAA